MDELENVSYLRIDLCGSEYRPAQEKVLLKEFGGDDCIVVLRGGHSCAAGAGLAFNVVVAVAAEIISVPIVLLVKNLFKRAKRALAEAGFANAQPLGITVEAPECDICIKTNCNAGTLYENVRFDDLIAQIKAFYQSEKDAGRSICKIETPCDIRCDSGFVRADCCGVGNFSIWRVTYRDSERWPYWIYDAVNDMTFPGAPEDVSALPKEDLFYQRPECGGDYCA